MIFQYAAIITRVIDGDTFVADIDLGFHCWIHNQTFRVLGCNAREHTDPGGREAASNLTTMLPAGSKVTLTSVANDKYGGRYDARITLGDGSDLTQRLVQDGWAAAWSGAGTKPTPPWPRTAS